MGRKIVLGFALAVVGACVSLIALVSQPSARVGLLAAMLAAAAVAAVVRVTMPPRPKVPLPPMLELPEAVINRPAELAAVVKALVSGRCAPTAGYSSGSAGECTW